MDELVQTYAVNATTWFWLSLLLTLAVFFRFTRVFSLRNLDLALLLSLTPALLMIRSTDRAETTLRDSVLAGVQIAADPDPQKVPEDEPTVSAPMTTDKTLGYIWLFGLTALILLRLCMDGFFRRRPRLQPNLNAPGLAFFCVAVSCFLLHKVVTEPPPASTIKALEDSRNIVDRTEPGDPSKNREAGLVPSIMATPIWIWATGEILAARLLATIAHIAVVVGLIVVGRKLFGDFHLGLAMGTLYLILPCTAFDVQKAVHVLPAALIVWAVVFFQRPMVAGVLMGLACGSLFFPIFLLPLWMTFYDRRGAIRFTLALGIVASVLLSSLVLTSVNASSFTQQVVGVFSFEKGLVGTADGFWEVYPAAYRIPVVVGFAVLLITLTIWPRRKTLEQLIAHSAAIVVSTQFWYPEQGGVYLLWYMPLVLIVIFRPRLAQYTPPTIRSREEMEDNAPRSAQVPQSARLG